MPCDYGGERLTTSLCDFFSRYGASFRRSCPHTSQQNGKAEHLIRTTNDMLHILLVQANLPGPFWVETLHFMHQGTHMRVFGCLCFPNTISTSPHKLPPHSSRCVFPENPVEHKGYRCLALTTCKVILSRHNTIEETIFPYFSPNCHRKSGH
jgi:hypothetical protein